jgi:hypothetical protein
MASSPVARWSTGRQTSYGDRRLDSPVNDWWRRIGRGSHRRAAAAKQRWRGHGNSDGGAGKADAQQCAAPGASMWPREDARQVTGRGGSAERRARQRSGGGRGNSGSSDRGAQLDQHAARGALVTHKKGFRSLRGRGLRLEGGAHRRRQWRNGGGSGRRRVRARSGRGWLISTREVGWGRWGHAGATCTRGEAGAWPATCAAPAANGAPQAVRRPVDQRHLARPTCHGRHGCAPASAASDQWSLRSLGVRARHGYGAYDGWPTWPHTTSRRGASRAFPAFSIC